MRISKNGAGIVIFFLSAVGISIAEADIVTTISTVGQVLSGLLILWNQVARSDVSAFLFKK